MAALCGIAEAAIFNRNDSSKPKSIAVKGESCEKIIQ